MVFNDGKQNFSIVGLIESAYNGYELPPDLCATLIKRTPALLHIFGAEQLGVRIDKLAERGYGPSEIVSELTQATTQLYRGARVPQTLRKTKSTHY